MLIIQRPYRRGHGISQALTCAAVILAAGCASAGSTSAVPNATAADPRVGLDAGRYDAEATAWNLELVSTTPSPEPFASESNTDLAFLGQYVFQGNYNGFQVWDASDPRRPELVTRYVCPASQSDVSVYRNLLFVSGEGLGGRIDCGMQGVPDPVSPDRLRGIRIFDISNILEPEYVANVQTCRGSHTHTLVTDPRDSANVYVYVSGASTVRSPEELPGCSDLSPEEDPNSALFRIEVIRVPLADPAQARIVTTPRIFSGLGPEPRRVDPESSSRESETVRTGPTQCHDITTYPEAGLAGGACRGYGLLLDISDVANPRRLDEAADSNFAFWHSATFSNDGDMVLFTDEWGGGRGARCRATDRYEWGANAIFTIEDTRLRFRSYYKMPAAQTATENCVAHNGSLIPIPDRDVMVQAWYQGGVSIFDWTDPEKPVEIAYFDRGPLSTTELLTGGAWSSYWYNGYIYSSEITRGLDVFALEPSAYISRNEIDAARTVRFDQYNPQMQQKLVWPPSFALARAYLDQLERAGGLAAELIASARADLGRAESRTGSERAGLLSALAGRLSAEASAAGDAAKVRKLAAAVAALADQS